MTEDDLRREFSFLWLGCLKNAVTRWSRSSTQLHWRWATRKARECKDNLGTGYTRGAPTEIVIQQNCCSAKSIAMSLILMTSYRGFFRTTFWLWKHDDVFDKAGFIYNNMKACTFSSSSSFTASISWREMKRNEDKANDKSHVNLIQGRATLYFCNIMLLRKESYMKQLC